MKDLKIKFKSITFLFESFKRKLKIQIKKLDKKLIEYGNFVNNKNK